LQVTENTLISINRRIDNPVAWGSEPAAFGDTHTAFCVTTWDFTGN
jgi:hypothetical protein